MIARAIASHQYEDKMFVILLFLMHNPAFQDKMMQHEPPEARNLFLLHLDASHDAWMRGYYLDRVAQTRQMMEPHTPRHLQTYGWITFESRSYYLQL